jgi:hypothetical protein
VGLCSLYHVCDPICLKIPYYKVKLLYKTIYKIVKFGRVFVTIDIDFDIVIDIYIYIFVNCNSVDTR